MTVNIMMCVEVADFWGLSAVCRAHAAAWLSRGILGFEAYHKPQMMAPLGLYSPAGDREV
jgi:hypothetical protein